MIRSVIRSTNWKAMVNGLALCGLALCVLLGGTNAPVLHAQEPKPKVVLPPTVEGDWVRTDEVGVGYWAAFDKFLPKPVLTPLGEQLLAKAPELLKPTDDISKKVGSVYVVRPHPCTFTGNSSYGLIEFDSSGFHAVKTKTELLIATESVGSMRRIYLDGRPLPAPGTRTPTLDGYSVGHFEADGTLVVETTDFPAGKTTAGGVRTPESILTQRYEPSADGTRLRIVFTWDDPKLFVKPLTYVQTFQRMAPDATAFAPYCDATDPLESQSVVPPAQK